MLYYSKVLGWIQETPALDKRPIFPHNEKKNAFRRRGYAAMYGF